MLTAIAEEDEIFLVHRAQRGDSEAFEQLILQYRGRVTELIYRMYGDENLADDAAQMAFIQAWRNLAHYQPKSGVTEPFRCWLFKIALNAAVDALRRDRPQVNIDEILAISREASLEVHIEDQERWSEIQQAVAELPDASRSVLILKEYQGLRYQEIASILDIPLGTVMSRLSYARKILAGKLSVYLEDV